jgi:dienelactone hydrolase
MINNYLIIPAVSCLLMSTGIHQATAQEASMSIGGGYTDPIVIPVDDAKTKNITAVLFKPSDGQPHPAIIYMSGCAGLNPPPDQALQKEVVTHSLSLGMAVLIVDPYTPRGENRSPCSGSSKIRNAGR